MPRDTPLRRITVATLAHPRMLATSMTLPVEILRAAAEASGERPRPVIVHRVVTPQGGTLSLTEGLEITTHPLAADTAPDILLVPAIWRHPRWVLRHHHWQVDEIARCIQGSSWVCSVGSGSFLVAETGALSGRSATTHWHWFDEFATNFPEVRLRRNQLITQSGRLFCAGSVNSIADLMVYLAGILFSTETATAIENQFSPEIRRRFSPPVLNDAGDAHNDEQVLDAQLWLRTHLQTPLDLAALSAAVGLSPRTLNRRFRGSVGMSPGDFLAQVRMEEARELLHESNLPIGEVAWSVGYADASAFSRKFREKMGVTPHRYRLAVRGKSFSLADSEPSGRR